MPGIHMLPDSALAHLLGIWDVLKPEIGWFACYSTCTYCFFGTPALFHVRYSNPLDTKVRVSLYWQHRNTSIKSFGLFDVLRLCKTIFWIFFNLRFKYFPNGRIFEFIFDIFQTRPMFLAVPYFLAAIGQKSAVLWPKPKIRRAR